jgi:hypothetical protein
VSGGRCRTGGFIAGVIGYLLLKLRLPEGPLILALCCAEPHGSDRMQPGSTTDIGKGPPGKPVSAQQGSEAALGFGDASIVDEAGIARPVLSEGEMSGQALQRRPRSRPLAIIRRR